MDNPLANPRRTKLDAWPTARSADAETERPTASVSSAEPSGSGEDDLAER
ncbi:hypothetical protein [Actinomadura algeriensis]|uniref:Uncharacterized protein n=1 Tax=Actinomadura algeriensis TaxID=1679523 RepID=A0ABR9JK63_9ACTN|nr:hypothetical protein [Actinomadura algeriensis]MBE1530930.1 hypothetical protein [Actinomadura algeriensis]